MKVLSIAVSCYNSEAYMEKCISSLLPGGEDVEILIVDDGSAKDRTPEIADEYAARYPSIIRAIHQENKGHGGAVNTGIDNATGLYFKVVDSDDWVDTTAYLKILDTLREIVQGPQTVDVLFSNYTYEKEGRKRKNYTMHYEKFFPENEPFGWDRVGHMDLGHYVLMHSLIYRTALLREVGLRLPEHTFYVDNIYAYIPFSRVNTMYYLNVDFYKYYIGRADQSVNEDVMLGRLDQQLRVNNLMIDYLEDHRELKGRRKQYMVHYLGIITIITSVLMIRTGDKEILKQKKELWQRLKKVDRAAYNQIRHSLLGIGANLPGRSGRKIVGFCYRMAHRIYGFD